MSALKHTMRQSEANFYWGDGKCVQSGARCEVIRLRLVAVIVSLLACVASAGTSSVRGSHILQTTAVTRWSNPGSRYLVCPFHAHRSGITKHFSG